MAQALPTTQSLSLIELVESSVAVPASRAGLHPAAGDGGTLPAAAPAVQSSIHHHPWPHHYRHRAERRQPIAGLRGCNNRGPSSREVRRVAMELRDAMEGVWFPVKGLERDARCVLSGKGDVALIGDVMRQAIHLPELLRDAHRIVQALCEVDSDQSGQLTLPVADRRCA